jgi:hypothetical protein
VRRAASVTVAVVAAILAAAGVWAGGLALMLSGWRDVDGFVDCRPSCNGWHRLGGLLFLFPPAFVAMLIVVAAVAAAASVRRRRST